MGNSNETIETTLATTTKSLATTRATYTTKEIHGDVNDRNEVGCSGGSEVMLIQRCRT